MNGIFCCTGEPWGFGEVFEIDRSEEFEEVSRDLRPAFDVKRSNLAEGEVEVDGCDFGECWSESVESPPKVTRTAEFLRRGGCIEVLITSGPFPFSSLPSLDVGVNDDRREIEAFRWAICCSLL